jgi:4-hydroxy-2-oxoheptanedioate aldolase
MDVGQEQRAASGEGGLVAHLRSGGRAIGTWCSLDADSIVELLALAGFDVVLIDLEHGEIGTHALPTLLRAVTAGSATPLVRVREPSQLGPALDAGAPIVMAPDVTSAEAARAVVAACRYAPLGRRGAAPMVRDASYALRPFAEHVARTDPLIGVQVEGPEGIAELDAILAVPGVGLVFIGPFDLAVHLGVPGQVDHPAVVAAVRDIVARADARGIVTGAWAPDVPTARLWFEAGVDLVSVDSATTMLARTARGLVAELGAVLAEGPAPQPPATGASVRSPD